MMSETYKMTAEDAQKAQDQLSHGKKTLNEIRGEYGLDRINDEVADQLIVKKE